MKRSRVLGAAGLTLVLASVSPGAIAVTAGAPGGEATIAAAPSATAPERYVSAAGTGLQTQSEGNGAALWRSLKDGTEVGDSYCVGLAQAWTLRLGDLEACTGRTAPGPQGPLTMRDFATGAYESLPSQPNRTWLAAVSPTQVLTTETRPDGKLALHLLGRGNEPRKDVPVATSEQIDGGVQVREVDARGALLQYRGPTGVRLGLVDYATATMRALPLVGANEHTFIPVGLGRQWAAASTAQGKVTLMSRDGVAGPRTIDARAGGKMYQMGDWLIAAVSGYGDGQVLASPLSGGAARIVLPALARDVVTGSDGNLYGVGGPDRYHWGIHRISLNAQGIPVTEELESLPSQSVQRYGPTLTHGELTVRQIDDIRMSTLAYRASVSGPVSVSPTPTWDCSIVHDLVCSNQHYDLGMATGDGRLVATSPHPDSGCLDSACNSEVLVQEARPGGSRRTFPLATSHTGPLRNARIRAVSGRYAVISASPTIGTAPGFVVDIESGKVLDNISVEPYGVFALWGSMLWRPEGGTGVIAATDLRTGQVVKRVDLRTGCFPGVLQVVGDWFYTSCSADASTYTYAAFHAPTGRSTPLPFEERAQSEVQLGDGYVVLKTRSGLDLYNLRSGKLEREHVVWASTWWKRWTVDRFGSAFAYIDETDEKDVVHLVGVTGKTSPLTVIDQSIPSKVTPSSPTGGNTRWWLSKPAASWKLTVRNTTSGITSVVRSGGEARGLIDVAWDGTDQNGKRLYGGTYEWTLTSRPADGHGPAAVTTGTLSLASAPVAVRPPTFRASLLP
ncbi:FlgD immunoglobulin-like domain containing protein [Streptomyces sp. NPDC059979]|uniref:FlgD immunoglobulin-like domain containing protein n=1 Tax=Streptomyces sp. NPDC059979 TaxID=3347021 RepID=UPI00368162C7